MNEELKNNIRKLQKNIEKVGLDNLKTNYQKGYQKCINSILFGLQAEMLSSIHGKKVKKDSPVIGRIQLLSDSYKVRLTTAAVKKTDVQETEKLLAAYKNEVEKITKEGYL